MYNPEQFTATNITLSSNSFNSYEAAHKTLIWISKIAVVKNEEVIHSLTNVHIESSVINLISFGGFTDLISEPVTTIQAFAFSNITFKDLQIEQEENLISFSDFIA